MIWDMGESPRYLGFVTVLPHAHPFFLRAGYLRRTNSADVYFTETDGDFGLRLGERNIQPHFAGEETSKCQVACPKVKRGIPAAHCKDCPYWSDGAGLWSCRYHKFKKRS